MDRALREPYALEDITSPMSELGFEKKTIHVPKQYRKSHEREKQCCYVRGSEEERKKWINLDEFDRSIII